VSDSLGLACFLNAWLIATDNPVAASIAHPLFPPPTNPMKPSSQCATLALATATPTRTAPSAPRASTGATITASAAPQAARAAPPPWECRPSGVEKLAAAGGIFPAMRIRCMLLIVVAAIGSSKLMCFWRVRHQRKTLQEGCIPVAIVCPFNPSFYSHLSHNDTSANNILRVHPYCCVL